MLERLALHGAGDAESYGAGDRAAKMHEEKQSGGGGAIDVQGASDRAKGRGKVKTRTIRLQAAGPGAGKENPKRLAGRGDQGSPLGAAGAVGDVVRGENIAKPVGGGKGLRTRVNRGHEGKGRPAQLDKAGADEIRQIGAAAQLAVPPSGLEPSGVGEAAGGEG